MPSFDSATIRFFRLETPVVGSHFRGASVPKPMRTGARLLLRAALSRIITQRSQAARLAARWCEAGGLASNTHPSRTPCSSIPTASWSSPGFVDSSGNLTHARGLYP